MGDTPTILLIIFFLVFIFVVVSFGIKSNRKEIESNKKEKTDILNNAFIKSLGRGILSPLIVEGFLLSKNEYILFHSPAILIEEGYVFENSGVVLPGGYGTEMYVGTSEPINTLQETDRGSLTLTTQRFIYTGRLRTVNIQFGEIVNINFGIGYIALHSVERQKTVLFKTEFVEIIKKLFDLLMENKDDVYFDPKLESLVFPSFFRIRLSQNSHDGSESVLTWTKRQVDIISKENDPIIFMQNYKEFSEILMNNTSQEIRMILSEKLMPLIISATKYAQDVVENFFSASIQKKEGMNIHLMFEKIQVLRSLDKVGILNEILNEYEERIKNGNNWLDSRN